MPKFEILRKVEAVAKSVATVEADTIEEAMEMAVLGTRKLKWDDLGIVEFSARTYVPIDAHGDEIEERAYSHK
jgi:hypothetical protein